MSRYLERNISFGPRARDNWRERFHQQDVGQTLVENDALSVVFLRYGPGSDDGTLIVTYKNGAVLNPVQLCTQMINTISGTGQQIDGSQCVEDVKQTRFNVIDKNVSIGGAMIDMNNMAQTIESATTPQNISVDVGFESPNFRDLMYPFAFVATSVVILALIRGEHRRKAEDRRMARIRDTHPDSKYRKLTVEDYRGAKKSHTFNKDELENRDFGDRAGIIDFLNDRVPRRPKRDGTSFFDPDFSIEDSAVIDYMLEVYKRNGYDGLNRFGSYLGELWRKSVADHYAESVRHLKASHDPKDERPVSDYPNLNPHRELPFYLTVEKVDALFRKYKSKLKLK